jgi:hypothetical protein
MDNSLETKKQTNLNISTISLSNIQKQYSIRKQRDDLLTSVEIVFL